MRVLCCLDGTNSAQVGAALKMFTAVQPLNVGMVHVTDTRPRKDIDLIRERFLRPPLHAHHPPAPPGPHPREEEMSEAEKASADEILNEGCQHFPAAESMKREGRPEQEIVKIADEWHANLVIVCSRAADRITEEIGPKSVGHVARFVVDHAPCPVLLLRPMAGH